MSPEAFIGQEAFQGQLAVKVRPEKVDTTDRKILYLLSLNARISNTTIAKHLKLSRETVVYRIKRMQESNVLHGFLTLVDIQKAGLYSKHIGIKLHTTVEAEEVLKELGKNQAVTSLSHCGGIYDIHFSITGKDLQYCYTEFQKILSAHRKKIRHYDVSTKLEHAFLGVGMLIENSKEKEYLDKIRESKGSCFQEEFSAKKDFPITGLDETDKKIINVLKLNARIPLAELSKESKISVFLLQNKIRKMIRQDIIQAFVPYISLAHFGLQFNFIFLNIAQEIEQKFKRYVEQHPYIVWRTKYLGHHNYRITLFVKNNAHLLDILNELHQEFGEGISQIECGPVFRNPRYIPFR